MKIVEFTEKDNTKLPFDVVEDVIVFMRNDPMFYRKHYYPAFAKIADMTREGKKCNQREMLSDMVECGLSEYVKKYKLAEMPDEIFNQDDRNSCIERIFSEEMTQIQKGEYK